MKQWRKEAMALTAKEGKAQNGVRRGRSIKRQNAMQRSFFSVPSTQLMQSLMVHAGYAVIRSPETALTEAGDVTDVAVKDEVAQ